MARVFWDGAERGNTAFWSSVSAGFSATTAQARSGSYSYVITQSNTFAAKNITALSEFYFRTGLYVNPTANGSIFLRFYNNTTEIAYLEYIDATGLIQGRIGGSVVASSSFPITKGAWYRIEVHYKMTDTVLEGKFELRIDGINAFSYTGDTKPGTATTIDNIRFFTDGDTMYFDDLALNDTTGSIDNSWCGDGRIVLNTRDSDTLAGWTNSNGTQINNYDYVNNIPPSAQYIASATPGAIDRGGVTTLDLTNKTVLRVAVEAGALDEAGGGQIRLNLTSGATTVQSDPISLTASYTRQVGPDQRTDPATGAAWTQTGIDAVEVGVEVV